MDSKEFEKYLISLRACNVAMSWASGKSWSEVYTTCDKANWLLWLYCRTKRFDNRKYVLAKASCALLIKKILPQSFQDAIDVAIKYGNGEGTEEEIDELYRRLINEQRDIIATHSSVSFPAIDAVIYMLRNSTIFTSVWDAALAHSENSDVKLWDTLKMMSYIVREVIPFEDWDLSNT